MLSKFITYSTWAIFAGICLSVLVYASLFVPVFLHAPSVFLNDKNSISKGNKTLAVPKTAKVGEEITVEIFYMPRLWRYDELVQIDFKDNAGAYDLTHHIRLRKISPDTWESEITLDYYPLYKTFKYKIPSKVCPLEIVYTTCPEVATTKGKGQIRLIYEPQYRDIFDGEGYQGDGEVLAVPIEIK